MKAPRIKPVSFAAIAVFVLAFLFNIQTNLNGGLGLFNQSIADDTGDSGSGDDFWADELFFVQGCSPYEWHSVAYYDWTNSFVGHVFYINGVIVEGQVMTTGTYAYSNETSGTGHESERTGWQCPSEEWSICEPCTDPCGSACSSGV